MTRFSEVSRSKISILRTSESILELLNFLFDLATKYFSSCCTFVAGSRFNFFTNAKVWFLSIFQDSPSVAKVIVKEGEFLLFGFLHVYCIHCTFKCTLCHAISYKSVAVYLYSFEMTFAEDEVPSDQEIIDVRHCSFSFVV